MNVMGRKQTVLITVLGSSPAVITETLYALYQHQQFPYKIVIFTTLHGKKKFEESDIRLQIECLCNELGIAHIKADQICLLVVTKDGAELEDIRSESDQSAMADFITKHVRLITHDDTNNIHASIAGGRKSMSFYMGYIFAMFAREDDSLSHVLVPPQYELVDFYYPTKQSKPLNYFDHNTQTWQPKLIDGKYLDAMDAKVELATIPFLRLNNSLTKSKEAIALAKDMSYSDCVAAYQLAHKPDDILIKVDTIKNIITINDRKLALADEYYAYYRTVLEACKNNTQMVKTIEIGKLSAKVLRYVADCKGLYLNKTLEEILEPKIAEDILEEIGDGKSLTAFLNIYKHAQTNGNQYYLDNNFHSKAKSAVLLAISQVHVGQTIQLCSINIVKNQLSTMSSNQVRQVTKNGYIGVMLNPIQIQIN
jgi:CRISPR-associated protein (TIGR02584 family)